MKVKRRDHISWSQLNMYERDPNDYYNKYVLDITYPDTPAMILGKWVADELNKKKSKNPLIEMFREFIPQCKKREHEMKEKLDGLLVDLLGYLDGFNEEEEEIIEIKTGRKWTQKMVDNHGQLDFYALMYYIHYRKLPKSIKLVWIKTDRDENGELYLTGEFKVFRREIRLKDIILMSTRIKKADKGIAEMYEMIND